MPITEPNAEVSTHARAFVPTVLGLRLGARTFVAALCLCVAALLSQSTGVADAGTVRIHALRTSPGTIVYPGTRHLRYRIAITSGATAEQFAITADGFRDRVVAGHVLQLETLRASPPAVTEGGTEQIATVTCGFGTMLAQGYEPHTPSLYLTLPPYSTTTVTATAATGALAPVPGQSYRIRWRLSRRFVKAGVPSGPGTLQRDYSILSPPSKVMRHVTGVRFRLRTSPATVNVPASVPGRRIRPPHLQTGSSLTVRGATFPALSRQQVQLRVLAPRVKRLGLLTTVFTDSTGHFRYRWKLRVPAGLYQVLASYRSQRRTRASSFSCPNAFFVRSGAAFAGSVGRRR